MAAGPDDEVEAEGRGAAAGQARIEDHVIADGKLEHIEAEPAGEVEETDVGVRPAPGEEITMGPVLHAAKIRHLPAECKPRTGVL